MPQGCAPPAPRARTVFKVLPGLARAQNEAEGGREGDPGSLAGILGQDSRGTLTTRVLSYSGFNTVKLVSSNPGVKMFTGRPLNFSLTIHSPSLSSWATELPPTRQTMA